MLREESFVLEGHMTLLNPWTSNFFNFVNFINFNFNLSNVNNIIVITRTTTG
ncbi:hypothetical protein TRV_08152 [Trichophyton verrucosum HKI 0517]|uniref:Uncharacterized protein n=1 Tax=Trichophyton verrucosum (strain HKI 0517) TaxID=663202 RepID=D4DLS8_TRIVH|nr:uncharacterized protein TRV_08152 [Trichophyton verrucosum HKI 0517]EFE37212.1 hypothetical protein TRV_08152 [Trichophyton verrucosum HKI 0517]